MMNEKVAGRKAAIRTSPSFNKSGDCQKKKMIAIMFFFESEKMFVCLRERKPNIRFGLDGQE